MHFLDGRRITRDRWRRRGCERVESGTRFGDLDRQDPRSSMNCPRTHDHPEQGAHYQTYERCDYL